MFLVYLFTKRARKKDPGRWLNIHSGQLCSNTATFGPSHYHEWVLTNDMLSSLASCAGIHKPESGLTLTTICVWEPGTHQAAGCMVLY